MTSLLLGIFIGCMCLGGVKLNALAESESEVLIDAQLLTTGKSAYDIVVTIQNLGADWEGTARLFMGEDYRMASAYDTMISLPQGSTKQFTVRVPRTDQESSDTGIKVALLDKKSKEVAGKEFDYFFRSESYALSMGILSDSYSSLTYLDMGGNTIYFQQEDRPIHLVELTQDNLTSSLDGLAMLVIDNYNTGVLTEEEIEAIEDWNQDGGILLVGTGSRGEETLAGFKDSYLGVSCEGSYQKEEYEDTWAYKNNFLEESKLSLAGITDEYGAYQSLVYGGLNRSVGEGAAGILPYSLTELGKAGSSVYQDDMDQVTLVRDLLDDVCSSSNSRFYSPDSYDYNSSTLTRFLRGVSRSDTNLNFGVLKILIVLYVIFAGPILYIILRVLKKRELYWVAVPVSAVAGILLVFLAGRGFEVVSTKVYSVTVENLSGRDESKAYLYCFDANHREWDLRLADRFDYVGGYESGKYGYDSWENGEYYQHIKMEGDTLSFGIRPSGGFEDCFFVAGATGGGESSVGTLKGEDIKDAYFYISGKVTNETNRNLAYFAVYVDNELYVYENLPAGQSVDLTTLTPVFEEDSGSPYRGYVGVYSMSDYLYTFIGQLYRDRDYDKIGAASALGVGLCTVAPQMDGSNVIIIGVTENWDKTVNDNCSEVSYGCLYAMQ